MKQQESEQMNSDKQEPPVLDAEELFRNGNQVLLRYRSQEYRLQLTKTKKLILTK